MIIKFFFKSLPKGIVIILNLIFLYCVSGNSNSLFEKREKKLNFTKIWIIKLIIIILINKI